MVRWKWLGVLFLALAGVVQGAEPVAMFEPEARILFQGDSITDGNRGRSADPNHILGHGYQFIVAAKQGAAFAEHKLEFSNRGISGNTVLDLEKRWQKDTLDLKPTVLSILIGVNDNSRGVTLEQYEQTYDKLLAATQTALPKIKFVLCEPFTLATPGKERPAAWNEELAKRGLIVAKLAQKYDAAFVPFQQAFHDATKRAPAAYWIWDSVHPTYAGHQIMADAWESAVRTKWGKK
jgi:lysophospholipase L1-like esterase